MRRQGVLLLAVWALWQLTGCDMVCEKGSGNVVIEDRNLPEFNAIEAGGAIEIFLIAGDSSHVVVEAEDNMMRKISTEVHDGLLKVSFNGCFNPSTSAKLRITVHSLEKLKLSGSINAFSVGTLAADEMQIQTSGACNLRLKLDAEILGFSASGATEAELEGYARNLKVQVNGAGDINALQLAANDAEVRVKGAGKCWVNVITSLDAQVNGVGEIEYVGAPVNIQTKTSGAGTIKQYRK